MYNKTETVWTKEITDDMVSLRGAYVRTLSQTTMGGKGITDRIISGSLYSVLVEFKGPKTKITGAQVAFNKATWYRLPGSCYYARRLDSAIVGVLYAGDDPTNEVPLGMFSSGVELDTLLRALAHRYRVEAEARYVHKE